MAIVIDGRNLTVEEVIRVARMDEQVEIAPAAQIAVKKARDYVDQKLAEGAVIYGLTTGFGKFSDTFIGSEDVVALQRNLIISHSCAMGEPLPRHVVRAAMLMRCNALSRGNSGIRPETLNTLLTMLNKGVHPIIPEKGSLGASGDLAPLSHMVMSMIGEGEAEYKGKVMKSAEAMRLADIPVVQLAAKEGLALINGTQIMTAIGANVLWDAMSLMKVADVAVAMTAEAINGIKKAYDPKLQEVRGHQGQKDAAENLRTLLSGSENANDNHPHKVQDPYSLRCAPQVHGATRDAINYVGIKEISKNGHDEKDGFIWPSYVEDIMGPMLFDYGYGPFRWVCLSGNPEDLDTTDQAAMDCIDPNRRFQDRDNCVWIRDAKKNKMVVGTQARILYQDAEGRMRWDFRYSQTYKSGFLQRAL